MGFEFLEGGAARARGHPLYAQAPCQPLSMDFQLDAAYPMPTTDGWPQSQVPAALVEVFADPACRDAVRADLAEPKGRHIFTGSRDLVEFNW